jgi:predicted nucleic acid-binding protein
MKSSRALRSSLLPEQLDFDSLSDVKAAAMVAKETASAATELYLALATRVEILEAKQIEEDSTTEDSTTEDLIEDELEEPIEGDLEEEWGGISE